MLFDFPRAEALGGRYNRRPGGATSEKRWILVRKARCRVDCPDEKGKRTTDTD